jgi:TRAP-type mannitol/chloroaromatic compound transport system permease small subunit
VTLPVDARPGDSYGMPLPGRLQGLTRAMNAAGTLWIVALMLLINADLLMRNLFAAPIRGTTELVALSIVGIVFLQLPDTLYAGRMTRTTVFMDRLQRRHPRVAALVHALHHLAGFGFMAVTLWASWEPLMESVRIREYIGAIGDFTAPVWPVRLITLLGLGCTALMFALLAWLDARRWWARGRPAAKALQGMRT